MTKQRLAIVSFSVVSLVWACSGLSGPGKGAVYNRPPEPIDPKQEYLFYMHGAWIEMKGLNTPHPRHGNYEYDNIVRALSHQGFAVISEPRLNRVDGRNYARKIVTQVRDLMEKGAPPENITVIGHSKGGMIALLVATLVEEKKVNFVIMAGCGRKETRFRRVYEPFLQNRAALLQGQLLSLYDKADRVAGTCREAFSATSEIESREIVFNTGQGHGLFYSPEPIWIKEVVMWAGLRSQ
jgi:pimeloyl-ACP methyl ester carboxylesterase